MRAQQFDQELKSQQANIEQAEKNIEWYKEENRKIEEQKIKNDKAVRAEEGLVEELRAAKLVTEGSKAAFYLSAGLDPEETKKKLDIIPKEFRDKMATLKGGRFRKVQMHMNSFEALFDEDQMSDEDEVEVGEEIASDDEEDLADDDEGPGMLLDIFGDEPPPAQGMSPEGKLFTEEQVIEGLRKKAKGERKAAYVTPEKKRKSATRKACYCQQDFWKTDRAVRRSPKQRAHRTPPKWRPVEVWG